MKILVTGGTVFVSKRIAQHFVQCGHDVYVLNRGTKKQIAGVHLLKIDRHEPFDISHLMFDAVIDVCAYTKDDVELLLKALNLKALKTYILISSSAVYSQDDSQPFSEDLVPKPNRIWKKYGTDKIEAEQALQAGFEHYYILRPPYLYGPGNNVYREAFVFDCALADRPFYLPEDGRMGLQFFYIDDLVSMIDILLEKQPSKKVFNVGSRQIISVKDWVSLCYDLCHQKAKWVHVSKKVNQRSYFPFYDYDYRLQTDLQDTYLLRQTDLKHGLSASLNWYLSHPAEVKVRPYIDFIEEHLKNEAD